MERNFAAEIDALKEELGQVKTMLAEFFAHQSGEDTKKADKHHYKNIEPMRNMMPMDKALSKKMEDLCLKADKKGCSGLITYMGVFASGGRQANWIKPEVNTDKLLSLIENNTASKVLSCIGSTEKLSILQTVLKNPSTVAEIVEKCHFTSTGQAYHHLKPLLAADLICEDEKGRKGVYVVRPQKVQGIIMLLAGICDMVDGTTYTRGIWEEAADQ